MSARRRTRQALVVLGGVLVFILIVASAAPLWLPWVLAPLVKRSGLVYQNYQRAGYTRFLLKDVEYRHSSGIIRANEVELPTPIAWLWGLGVVAPRSGKDFATVRGWRLELNDGANDRPKQPVYEIVKQLRSSSSALERFLPAATLFDGVVVTRDSTVRIPKASWNDGRLETQLRFADESLNARVRLDDPSRIELDVPKWGVSGLATLEQGASDLTVEGRVQWLTNQLELTAVFGKEGRLPTRARFQAEAVRVPGELLRLPEVGAVQGRFHFEWITNRFNVELAAEGNGPEALGGFKMNMAAHGATNRIQVDALEVVAPWLEVNLSEPVELSFRGELLNPGATFEAKADLGKQTWVEHLEGRVRGELSIQPGAERMPDASLEVTGTGLSISGIEIQRLALAGGLAWPWLQLRTAVVQLSEGAMIVAGGSVNLTNRFVTNATVRLNGPAFRDRLPGSFDFQNLRAEGQAHGPISNLTHSGRIQLEGVKNKSLAPVAVDAAWRGQGFQVQTLTALASVANSEFRLEAAGEWREGAVRAELRQMELAQRGKPHFRLVESARVIVAGSGEGTNWQVELSPLRLAGVNSVARVATHVQWPERGQFSVSCQGLSSEWLGDFVPEMAPKVQIDHFQWAGGWTNGPVEFELSGAVRLDRDSEQSYRAEFRASAASDGLKLEPLAILTGQQAIVSGQGSLPLVFNPSRGRRMVQLHKDQPLQWAARSVPNDSFWNRVRDWTGIALTNPKIDLRAEGTIDQLRALATVKIDAVHFANTNWFVPKLEWLDATMGLNRRQFELHELNVAVEDQWICAKGRIPLGTNFTSLRRALCWSQATGQVRATNVQIARLAPLFPKLLSPQGTLDLDISARPGSRLTGSLKIDKAATRPLIPVGGLDDISVHLNFSGSDVRVEQIRAFLGGEPIAVTGGISLAKEFMNGWPVVELFIRGRNLPVVRSPDLILRSDLSLDIRNTTNGVPMVAGSMELQDSFLMRDLRDLVPAGVTTPKRRPPYFSVDSDLLRDWRLDLSVRGDDFLRIRSPVFRGDVSAILKIEGTLSEPIALGDVRIHSGVVQFPFAALRVRQGTVSLTSENPHRPQLFVIAGDRVFGYDIRIEARGPADQPNIEFSSTPGLSSEQIVLLLTTGKLPRDQAALGQQQRVTRIGVFLGRNLLTKFGPGEGSADRLTIRTGEHISEQGKQTYSAEYKLTDRWSVVGEYDRFNAFNLGLKWRVYSR